MLAKAHLTLLRNIPVQGKCIQPIWSRPGTKLQVRPLTERPEELGRAQKELIRDEETSGVLRGRRQAGPFSRRHRFAFFSFHERGQTHIFTVVLCLGVAATLESSPKRAVEYTNYLSFGKTID